MNWLNPEKKNTFQGGNGMDDLDKFIGSRKKRSILFAKNFDKGYEHFKIGVVLKQARLEAGFT